jgi:hypothetical protein
MLGNRVRHAGVAEQTACHANATKPRASSRRFSRCCRIGMQISQRGHAAIRPIGDRPGLAFAVSAVMKQPSKKKPSQVHLCSNTRLASVRGGATVGATVGGAIGASLGLNQTIGLPDMIDGYGD